VNSCTKENTPYGSTYIFFREKKLNYGGRISEQWLGEENRID
jgi:hypothetical protein